MKSPTTATIIRPDRPAAGEAFPVATSGNGSGPDDGQRTFAETLLRYRDLVIREIGAIIAGKGFNETLAQRLAEYPLRAGKGLRPALCLATCQAFGGSIRHALQSAAALELFHNAFLVHDDIEDESIHRRGAPTIHQKYGVAIAINVGDALNVLTMTPLLANLEIIGLEKTLRVFREIERMGRESVEGQAMELDWVKNRRWDLSDPDYHLMTLKKTCWYTCITPCRVGALIGGGFQMDLDVFTRFGSSLGIAFQIQDDLLNLMGEEGKYGKETAGDIREGKRTLMLIKLLERASQRDRRSVVRILSKQREDKTDEEVDEVLRLMRKHDCLQYGREASVEFARQAKTIFRREFREVPDSPHRLFLEQVIDYVIHREL